MATDMFLFIHVFFMVTLCSTKRCRVAQKTIVSTKEIYHIEVKATKKIVTLKRRLRLTKYVY